MQFRIVFSWIMFLRSLGLPTVGDGRRYFVVRKFASLRGFPEDHVTILRKYLNMTNPD